jgi:Protein of unknown function (DUF4233)
LITLSAGNPMRVVLMTVLIFEMIVFGLAIPVMIFISEVSATAAGVVGGAAAALPVVAAALLRSRVGYVLGWIAQVAGLALGLLTPMMFIVGTLFAAVWVLAFVLGKRLDSRMETSPEGGDIP